VDVKVPNTAKRLLTDIELLDENHNGRLRTVKNLPVLLEFRVDVLQVEFEVLLPRRHLVPRRLHRQCRVLVADRRIGTDGLVLAVDENPEADVVRVVAVVPSDLRSEVEVRLSFRNAVSREIRGGNGAFVEGGKIEALVLLESLLRDDLRGESGVRLSEKRVERKESKRRTLAVK
jgi:hypothetical protein